MIPAVPVIKLDGELFNALCNVSCIKRDCIFTARNNVYRCGRNHIFINDGGACDAYTPIEKGSK
jgi:hypothetical protein